MPDTKRRLAYSVDEIAEATGLCQALVRRRIRQGALPARRDGARVLVLHDDLQDYLRTLPPAAPPREEKPAE